MLNARTLTSDKDYYVRQYTATLRIFSSAIFSTRSLKSLSLAYAISRYAVPRVTVIVNINIWTVYWNFILKKMFIL